MDKKEGQGIRVYKKGRQGIRVDKKREQGTRVDEPMLCEGGRRCEGEVTGVTHKRPAPLVSGGVASQLIGPRGSEWAVRTAILLL